LSTSSRSDFTSSPSTPASPVLSATVPSPELSPTFSSSLSLSAASNSLAVTSSASTTRFSLIDSAI